MDTTNQAAAVVDGLDPDGHARMQLQALREAADKIAKAAGVTLDAMTLEMHAKHERERRG
jgi:hypothetical protein